MDTNPLGRLLEPGELVHVDEELRVTSEVVVPDPPAQMLELTTQEELAQQEDPAAAP
jgi:glutamine amidotransferase